MQTVQRTTRGKIGIAACSARELTRGFFWAFSFFEGCTCLFCAEFFFLNACFLALQALLDLCLFLRPSDSLLGPFDLTAKVL